MMACGKYEKWLLLLFLFISLCGCMWFGLSLSHTHTHTHAQEVNPKVEAPVTRLIRHVSSFISTEPSKDAEFHFAKVSHKLGTTPTRRH